LDPGTRTFQTIYSERRATQIKINKDLITKLYKKIDLLQSLRDKKIISRSSSSKSRRRLQCRFNNLIDDLHHKTASYLTDNYNTIILPPFESQEMVKSNRSKAMNRGLLQLKHYLFKQRLQSKCASKHCDLILHTEEYTTQTCGRCGCVYSGCAIE
jgi:putative transposase